MGQVFCSPFIAIVVPLQNQMAKREVDVASHHPIRSFILGSLSCLLSLSLSVHIAYFPRTPFIILSICAGQNGARLYFWNFQEQLERVYVTLLLILSRMFASDNCNFLA